jgi:hypothetical protein
MESSKVAVIRQATHLAYPSNVFCSIFLRESKVLIQAKANIIPVEPVSETLQVKKMLL